MNKSATARLIGVPQPTLSNWITGKSHPSGQGLIDALAVHLPGLTRSRIRTLRLMDLLFQIKEEYEADVDELEKIVRELGAEYGDDPEPRAAPKLRPIEHR